MPTTWPQQNPPTQIKHPPTGFFSCFSRQTKQEQKQITHTGTTKKKTVASDYILPPSKEKKLNSTYLHPNFGPRPEKFNLHRLLKLLPTDFEGINFGGGDDFFPEEVAKQPTPKNTISGDTSQKSLLINGTSPPWPHALVSVGWCFFLPKGQRSVKAV